MMGVEHINNLALIDGAQLVAIADPVETSRMTAAQAAKPSGAVKAYADWAQMIAEEDLDAVILSSPNFTHYEITKALLKTNLGLLIEKPLCTTVEHAREIHALSEARGGLFWTGMEYRYMPPATEFISRAHDGVTGEIKMLSIREHRFPFLEKVGDWNRFNENTGGTLVEKCCHFFDLMRHILRDEAVAVMASGAQDVNHLDERYDGRTPDILDNAFVTVEFARGARASLDLCMFAEGSEQQEEIYVLGDKGKLDVKIPSAELTFSPRSPKGAIKDIIDTPEHALDAGTHHGATYFQLSAFQDALASGGKAAVTSLDGLRSVEIGAAAHRSIAERRFVRLDEL